MVTYTGVKYAPRFTAVGASWEPWRQAPDHDDADPAATFPRSATAEALGLAGPTVST
ncbi:hypothetical protein ACI8AK_12690 [Geodermatophilus sp. SYSU D00867]